MARFTITQQDGLHHYLDTSRQTARLWNNEIVKFRCPRHCYPAKLYFENNDGAKDGNKADSVYVEACCREHFEFCLKALNQLLATDRPAEYHIPKTQSSSSAPSNA